MDLRLSGETQIIRTSFRGGNYVFQPVLNKYARLSLRIRTALHVLRQSARFGLLVPHITNNCIHGVALGERSEGTRRSATRKCMMPADAVEGKKWHVLPSPPKFNGMRS